MRQRRMTKFLIDIMMKKHQAELVKYFGDYEAETPAVKDEREPIHKLVDQIDFYDECDQKIVERILMSD